MKMGNVEQFAGFSRFKDVKEFNSHIEMWMVDLKEKFTKGERIALKRLVRFAAKIPGVSIAKIGTILKAIHEKYGENAISRSTFKRCILKAKAVGLLTVHETERKNGSQSSNLYVFNRYTIPEPPKVEKLNHPNKTSNLIKTNNQQMKERKENELDDTFTCDRVPSSFVSTVKYFYSTAKEIEEFWRMALIAAYRNNREQEKDTVLDLAIQSFKQMIGKLKSTRSVKNPIAYFYGVMNKKLEGLYIKELAEMGFWENGGEMRFFTPRNIS